MCGWLDLQPVALLEGVGMGEGGGGGGGPGRELVGSWSLGSRLLPATARARGQPAAGCSDLIMVNFLRAVDCVACMMLYYWNSGEKWNWYCNHVF